MRFSMILTEFSTLSHPNCVQFLGVFMEPSTKEYYIVTEYLKKGSLLDVLKKEKRSLKISDLIYM
jgi:serine/threonine protein kinase